MNNIGNKDERKKKVLKKIKKKLLQIDQRKTQLPVMLRRKSKILKVKGLCTYRNNFWKSSTQHNFLCFQISSWNFQVLLVFSPKSI